MSAEDKLKTYRYRVAKMERLMADADALMDARLTLEGVRCESSIASEGLLNAIREIEAAEQEIEQQLDNI